MDRPLPYENCFTSERLAHAVYRQHISRGATVSLLAYDPERDRYVFDSTLPYNGGE